MIVIPAIAPSNFAAVRDLAHRYGFAYALGIHPMYADQAGAGALEHLSGTIETALADPRFVALGEIGLDYYVETPSREIQRDFFIAQLRLARRFGLPVLLHSRRAVDDTFKYLRRFEVRGGIGHAFSGSENQARRWVELGFKLGFGGAMTYDGSLRIRKLAGALPDSAWVLETDAPDIPPQWRRDGGSLRNEPFELARIGAALARLRTISVERAMQLSVENAGAALPRLAALIDDRRHAPDAGRR
jgi:TatD DNase family protein